MLLSASMPTNLAPLIESFVATVTRMVEAQTRDQMRERVMEAVRGAAGVKRRGRPPGSRNKPKAAAAAKKAVKGRRKGAGSQ